MSNHFNFDEPETLKDLPRLPWCAPDAIEQRLSALRSGVNLSFALLSDRERMTAALQAFGLPLDLPASTHGRTTVGVQIAEETRA